MSRRYREEQEVDGGLPQLCRSAVEDEVRAFSPAMSTVSTQSHEVKHILQPPTRDREDDATSDYSHINIRPRHPDSAGPSFSRPPPPAYHHHESGGGGRFLHNRLWGSPSGHRHRFHSQVQTVSLDDVSGGDPVRRKSWSPPVQRHGAGGYHGSAKNSRSCYSSNMVDWDVGYHDNPPPYSRTTPPTNPPPYHHSSQYTYFLGQSHVQAHPISYPQGQPQGYSQGIQKHAVSGQFQGQGHVHNPVVCEESGDCLPPRLAPISGVLAQNQGRNLIRPIAFKPAGSGGRGSVCPHCNDFTSTCDCGSFTPPHPSSQPPTMQESPRSASVRSAHSGHWLLHSPAHTSHRHSKEGSMASEDGWVTSVAHSAGVRGVGPDTVLQTPSPSDSGVGELEAMLKEREAEIVTLRQVMDRNERAIFQVYEEKKSQWLQEMGQIKADYEDKLRQQQQKAGRLEQALAQQVRRLQHDKQQLQGHYFTLASHSAGGPTHTGGGPTHTGGGPTHTGSGPTHTGGGPTHTGSGLTHSHSMPRPHSAQSSTLPAPSVQDVSSSSVQWAAGSAGQSLAGQGKGAAGQVGGGGLATQELQGTEELIGLAGDWPREDLVAEEGEEEEEEEEVAMKNREILSLRSQLQTVRGQLQEAERQLSQELQRADSHSRQLQCVQQQLQQLSPDSQTSQCQQATQTSPALSQDGTSPSRPSDPSDLSDPSDPSEPSGRLQQAQEEYTRSLERQVDGLRQQITAAEEVVETERQQWMQEKNKVVRYQKQLQLNYLQMQRKNAALEAEVQQLTLELESRHLKLAAMNGEESVC